MKNNIAKGEAHHVSPFKETFFGVIVGQTIYNVDIKTKSCTCRNYNLSSIPCKQVCVVILSPTKCCQFF